MRKSTKARRKKATLTTSTSRGETPGVLRKEKNNISPFKKRERRAITLTIEGLQNFLYRATVDLPDGFILISKSKEEAPESPSNLELINASTAEAT